MKNMSKTMYRLLALVMAMAMVFGLAACGNSAPAAPAADSAPAASNDAAPAEDAAAPAEADTRLAAEVYPETFDASTWTDVSKEVYDAALGEYLEYYTEAKEAEDLSERFALMAIAEAKIMESGVMIPLTTRGGRYSISRVAPRTINSTLWGNDSDRFHNAVVAGFSDACQEMADQLFGLEDFNPASVIKALLDPLCKMAITAGEIIMLEGIATVAAKDALLSFGWTGYGAIAAGAALMAAGAAASAGLAALAKNGGSATSSSTYQGGGGAASTQTIKTELEVVVTGRISGRDLVLSGQRTVSENNR